MEHLSTQRYAEARVSFEQVIQQSSNMYLQARACICLGEIHFLIESEYDIKKTLNYFEVAYQQTDNPEAQAIAAYQMEAFMCSKLTFQEIIKKLLNI